jgi:diguanylate cyclase (GGDEF)-like protein
VNAAEGLLPPGEPVTLTNCDREAIHVPGAIQPHGVLLAVDPPGRVVTASANAAAALGTGTVLGSSLSQLLPDLPSDWSARTGPRPSVLGPVGMADGVWELTAHTAGDLRVLELEPTGGGTPHPPATTVHALERVFADIRGAEDLDALYQACVSRVRALTGHDRVMLYRFDPDWHGRVVAEDRRDDVEPYLGLHYPATDIPVQARRLYVANTLRVIADVHYSPVPLLPEPSPGAPGLDMSHCLLRSVSPIHVQYLRNMGVRATLVMSLLNGGALWGMIACHHYAPRRVPALLRAACAAVADLTSVQAQMLEARAHVRRDERLREARERLLDAMRATDRIIDGVVLADDALPAVAGATGAAASIDGETVLVGAAPGVGECARIAARLRGDEDGVRYTHALGEAHPDLAHLRRPASGALVLHVGGGDWIAWFRPEQVEEVTWAGRPDPDAGETLTPRASFAAWRETVRGRSQRWDASDIASAEEVGRAVPRLLLERARDRLSGLAMVDSLTGLVNRRGASELLEIAVRTAARPGEIGVAYLDLDHFKRVNDSLGHAGGDEVLAAVAQRLRESVRAGDDVARIGGDEFIVILRGLRTPAEASEVTQRVVDAFRTPLVCRGEQAYVTVSAGVALGGPDSDPQELVRDADVAMYRAKEEGRDQLITHVPGLGADLPERTDLANAIRVALDRDQFRLHYQPVRDRRGFVTGVEALIRWEHPTRGLLSPGAFMDLAEDSGLMLRIGEWVLRTALHQVRSWHDRGRDLSVAVNVASRQLDSGTLPALVEDCLAALRVPPERLVLEVTETSIMRRPAVALHTLDRLRHRGVHVAIDDFGTGFSSLSQLRRLPADILKIDRSFVSGITHDPLDASIARTVIQLASAAGMTTIGEGVETPGQARALVEAGCDALQGYLLGRPAPPGLVDLDGRAPRW